jgi:Family of unknown function (DUF6516)
MRDVSQHFELIEKAVEYSSATEAEFDPVRFDATSGLIEGVVYFADGSRLEFSELVMLAKHQPVKQKYRYQFVQSSVAVFRYDNAPHHEHVATHPHHKHVGAKILPAIEPDFKQVLEEAEALLSQRTNAAVSKKRRQRGTSKTKRNDDD